MRSPLLHRVVILILAAFAVGVSAADHPARVVWDSPSESALGSMPIGNGDIGANFWVEPNGDIVFYISKTDAFDASCMLLKVGRVRVKLDPPLIAEGSEFTQTLEPTSGAIRVVARSGEREVKLRFWIDANHPVMHLDVDSNQPVKMTADAEVWRTEPRELTPREIQLTAYGLAGSGKPVFVHPDTIATDTGNDVIVYHRNESSIWAENLELQALGDEAAKMTDPLLGRTFGYAMRGEGMSKTADTTLESQEPRKRWSLSVYPLTAITDTADAWRTVLSEQIKKTESLDKDQRWAAHEAWWTAFWDRSWIEIADAASPVDLPSRTDGWRVGVDSTGRNRFGGQVNAARVIGRALSAEQIAELASKQPDGDVALEQEALADGCTLSAWVKPAAGAKGRIIDNATAGKPDGFLFDSHLGLSLRWSVGRNLVTASQCLEADRWQHVAATIDAATGRQCLYVDGKLVAENTDTQNASPSRTITLGYATQRWMVAGSGRGNLPVKFNGSIFNVGETGEEADFRAWGGPYWWQNSRLIYWSTLYGGDTDIMRPFFKMYADALPLRKAATRKYYGHDGAFYPETMYFWGTYTDLNYGRNRTNKPDGLTDNVFIRRYWQGGIENVMLMLDFYDHTGDAAFRDQTLLPMAIAITAFFNEHWERGEDGKILFYPAQSLETWHDSKNPMPEIAGLRKILPRLLELPVDDAQRATWKDMLEDLAPVPTREIDGKKMLAPGETFAVRKNMENTSLYAVFPYRMNTLIQGGEALELAQNAWPHRPTKRTGGWFQDAINAALLGYADAAGRLVYSNAAGTERGYRFPAMWRRNYDWTPDQDHGSVMMIALQRMVMQCDGDAIHVLPAWPREWNVSFKLHAPKQTAVEGVYRDGKIISLKVTPEARRSDVVLPEDLR